MQTTFGQTVNYAGLRQIMTGGRPVSNTFLHISHKNLKKYLHYQQKYNRISKCRLDGSLVKRLRRRPLTAETGVRFPYELLTVYNSPTLTDLEISDYAGFRIFYFYTKCANKYACKEAYYSLN